MNGVIYARYSSDNQREESIDGQLRECKAFAAKNDIQILDTRKVDHRRRLVDSFINAIYLYDDRIAFVFNYKDGAETISFDELNDSTLHSDLTALGGPFFESPENGLFSGLFPFFGALNVNHFAFKIRSI